MCIFAMRTYAQQYTNIKLSNMAYAAQTKYTRVHYNGAAVYPDSVKGAKDLKMYVNNMTALLTSIQFSFERDLTSPDATYRTVCTCVGDYEFRCKMCEIAHRDFVHAATKLPQFSALIQAKEAAQECLGQTELVRKMMVANTQQNKTTIRKLLRMIAREKKAHMMLPALVIDKNPVIITQHLMRSVTLEEESPTVTGLRAMITETKQHHRTVAKKLLTQAAALMDAMRNQHLLAYNAAAEYTVGAIMTHATACSAFMQQSLRLSVVQFCASRWWNEFEKTAFDNRNTYHVTAELVSGLHDKFDVSHTGHYLSFLEEGCSAPDIQIVVYMDPALKNPNNDSATNDERILCSYMFDNALAEMILTDEAIEAFEDARANRSEGN